MDYTHDEVCGGADLSITCLNMLNRKDSSATKVQIKGPYSEMRENEVMGRCLDCQHIITDQEGAALLTRDTEERFLPLSQAL